jgi:hypothetical protein
MEIEKPRQVVVRRSVAFVSRNFERALAGALHEGVQQTSDVPKVLAALTRAM